MQYVSEKHTLISTNFDQGYWTSDINFGNWSTAVDTRSLSFCGLPEIGTTNNATRNLALLFYENSTKHVSALLQRVQKNSSLIQWVDITSQESRSLPDEFRNVPDHASTTLYESDTQSTFNAPFVSAAKFFGGAATALFYSPRAGVAGLGVEAIDYDTGTSGPGTFSSGMICKSLYYE